jgi:hypothetical protein
MSVKFYCDCVCVMDFISFVMTYWQKKIKEMKRSMKEKVEPLIGITDFNMAFVVRVMCSFD